MTSRSRVWLVGVGPLSIDYWKVLNKLGHEAIAIGRGEASAQHYAAATGEQAHQGGLEAFLASGPDLPESAIVVTGVEGLAAATLHLLDYGVKQVLVEKPGALTRAGLEQVQAKAAAAGATVVIGYNRRLFSSTLRARQMLVEDGGVRSFHFEFTEWSDRLAAMTKGPGVFERWVLSNSTHVIDLAFHLGGEPSQIDCFTDGGFAWHPAASTFAGAGRSSSGALFSYMADWDAPGRWALEVNSRNYRCIFRPMEQLQVVRRGSVQVEPVVLDDALDTAFKPGLFLQTKLFLEGDLEHLCTMDEQIRRWPIYEKIAGYSAG